MGSCSTKQLCTITCKCFINDTNVKNISVKRTYTSKWRWFDDHHRALSNIISVVYDINITAIIYLIEEYVSSTTENYCIKTTEQCTEQYYTKQISLRRKKLCASWCSTYLPIISPITFVICAGNVWITREILLAFRKQNKYLPALQQSYSIGDAFSSRHTICIDNCQITINLKTFDCFDYSERIDGFVIYFIVLDSKEYKTVINNLCDFIWNKNRSLNNCIFVRVKQQDNNDISEDLKMSQKWNIPYILLNLKDENGVTDVFQFAIKYYWFCTVHHQ